MAGSSTYPTTVDNKTALADGVDFIEADNVNNAYVPNNRTQTFVGANGKGASWSTDILEYLANTKAPLCTKASGSTISVSAGVVFIKNSGQSHRLMRRNTSAVTITAADIDTGALATGTYYYIFAVADSAATTFTCKFSLSKTAPTGLTNFELIGWFYNQANAALDITLPFVGNIKENGRDVPNTIQVSGTSDITTTSSSYVDMTDMLIRLVSSGRPVELIFSAPIYRNSGSYAIASINVDGVNVTPNMDFGDAGGHIGSIASVWLENLAAGTHTIKVQWKTDSSSSVINQRGSTDGPRILTAKEL